MSFEPISSAAEFEALITSDCQDQNKRASWATASDETWFDLLDKEKDTRFMVAHNRTIPANILKRLSEDASSRVRLRVAMKRKLPESIRQNLINDEDKAVANQAQFRANRK